MLEDGIMLIEKDRRDDLNNLYNTFQINIFGDNNTSPWTFTYNKETLCTSPDTYEGIPLACLGNENWGNAFINFMFENSTPRDYFLTKEHLDDKFCIIFLGPIDFPDEDAIGLQPLLIVDTDVYPLKTEVDADSGTTQYKYLFEFLFTEKWQIHTIESKYLGNIQSDNRELDSSQKSFIKNKFGSYCVADVTDSYLSQDIGKYKADLTFGSMSFLNMLNLKSEVVKEYLPEEVFPMLETCKVIIDDVVYENCPVFKRTGLVLEETNGYFIGNPKLLSDVHALYMSALQAEEYIRSGETAMEDDNGLPFLFCMANTERPLWDGSFRIFTDYSSNTSLQLTVIPQKIKLETGPVDPILLPVETQIGEYIEDTNSILFNSAYEASGSNSIAAGSGTHATGMQSIALGQDTTASGTNSLSIGQGSVASGATSLAMGVNSTASGKNSIAGGSSSVASGSSSIAFGEAITTQLYSVTRPSVSSVTFPAAYDISACGYTQCSFDSGSTWYNIGGTKWENGQCTINLSYCSVDVSQTTILLRKTTDATGNNAISIGKGNHNTSLGSVVFGEGNTSGADYQTIIGKYNEVDEEAAFIIGNGGKSSGLGSLYHNRSRSNALTVDWDGNANLSGSLTTNAILFNSNESTISTNKYLDLNNTNANEVQIQINSIASVPVDFTSQIGRIHNKNLWPITGWENSTHYGSTETFLDDGSYQLTYKKGSTVIFNVDGSVSVNYITGDSFSIYKGVSSEYNFVLPKGDYIISNGIGESAGIFFYLGSYRYTTNNFNGYSKKHENTVFANEIGIKTVSSSTPSFSATFYPQIEIVKPEVTTPSKYTVPEVDTFYFNEDGTYNLNLLKYTSKWENPYFIFPETWASLSISYHFEDLAKIPCSNSIISQAKKQNRYIIKLQDLKSQGQVQANIIWNKENRSFDNQMASNECGLCINIPLGYKPSENEAWISNFSTLPLSLFYQMELFNNSLLDTLGKDLAAHQVSGGLKLPGGYLIDSTNNKSLSTNDFKDLISNTLQLSIEDGDITLQKKIDSNTGIEYCYLLYYIHCYNAPNNLRQFCETTISSIDNFIFYLPEEQHSIFLN